MHKIFCNYSGVQSLKLQKNAGYQQWRHWIWDFEHIVNIIGWQMAEVCSYPLSMKCSNNDDYVDFYEA